MVSTRQHHQSIERYRRENHFDANTKFGSLVRAAASHARLYLASFSTGLLNITSQQTSANPYSRLLHLSAWNLICKILPVDFFPFSRCFSHQSLLVSRLGRSCPSLVLYAQRACTRRKITPFSSTSQQPPFFIGLAARGTFLARSSTVSFSNLVQRASAALGGGFRSVPTGFCSLDLVDFRARSGSLASTKVRSVQDCQERLDGFCHAGTT